MKVFKRIALLAIAASLATPAWAQFSEPVTSFETDREGVELPFQPASYGALEVVMFQDPAEADVTTDFIVDDDNANTNAPLPSSEESFVANFTEDFFPGANGTDQSLDIRFEWADPSNAGRWVLVETFQSPLFGDPALHLEGKVQMKINFPYFTGEFPELEYTNRIGVALLVRETGNAVPQGFRDGGEGALEFVGVSSVAGADTANPVPVPATFFNGPTSSGDAGWVTLEFDLDALETAGQVIGWTAEGGDGVLDATGVGDGVNRGVLAGLVLTVDATDTTSQYVEFMVDEIVFDAPVQDPTYPPSIVAPVLASQASVTIKDILSSATNVELQIDRADMDNEDPFVADETYNANPSGALTVDFAVPTLEEGDRVRARQTNPSGVSGFSVELLVNPPAAFSMSISLDEDGNNGAAPADFEFVGVSGKIGGAPQGKPVFRQNGIWQKVEFSLIPGVEPVIDFAGGNGQLQPDGGLYNIDSMWISIDPSEPNAGPYETFLDHVYYIDASDDEVLISDAEELNPFGAFRGQSTATETRTTALSTLASYDGTTSTRLTWEWSDAGTSNTIAPFRPPASFPDTAKAVGFWVLIEDARTNGIPAPSVVGPVVGDAPGATIDVDTNGTVELFINGISVGTTTATDVASVDFDLSATTLMIGDILTAQITTADGTSDLSYARGVTVPAAPAISGSLLAGQTMVDVSGLMTDTYATASTVTVYNGSMVIGTAPGGSETVSVNVSPALAALDEISATQIVNGSESAESPAVQVLAQPLPKVVINEFVYDDQDADDREFVELYNADTSGVDISGWIIRCSDTAAPPNDNNTDYTIANSVVLAPGEFYVLGAAGVPNLDQEITSTNTEGLFENANEAIQLLTDGGFVVDSVTYEINKGDVAVSPAEGGGLWGNMISQDATQASWSRFIDGRDTDVNGRDFGTKLATPGAANTTIIVPDYSGPSVDSEVVGDPVPMFHGSYVTAVVIDPTVADDNNLTAIPASPDGGNAIIAWDRTGGGNISASNFTINENGHYDVWIYLDANTTGVEEWNVGIGSSDPWAHNLLFNGANGSSGISWAFTRTTTSAQIQLVDHGPGGAPSTWNTLGTIDLSGQGEAWHRLAIYLDGESVVGIFDDQVVTGTTEAGVLGNFYIGFRESFAGTAGTRAPTIDERAPSGDADFDVDGDVDLKDFGSFQACFGGSTAAPCSAGDMDGDGDIDLADLNLFTAFMTGPQ